MVIKICGLRTTEQALAAAAAGADMLGFVLAPSRRQVPPRVVARAAGAVRQAGYAARIVGVLVNPAPEAIAEIARLARLDIVQLSGDEWPMPRALVPVPIIKAVRLRGDPHEAPWLAHLPADPRSGPMLLVDAHVPGSYGGAGIPADWEHAAALASVRPILLAGGLTPESVATAIARVRPWGVDVSSGVETSGVKDPARIRAFIQAARAAARETPG